MNKEREREILTLLVASEKKRLSVKELAERLYTSESSVRRDLASLEQKQLIRRTHGGAEIEKNSISEQKIPFVIRELEQSGAKIEIAKNAIGHIKDYDVIFLDASSSAYNLVPYLAMKSHLTVITSGIKALSKLGDYGIRAISTGGVLLPECQSLVGNEAQRTISQFNADAAFFSIRVKRNKPRRLAVVEVSVLTRIVIGHVFSAKSVTVKFALEEHLQTKFVVADDLVIECRSLVLTCALRFVVTMPVGVTFKRELTVGLELRKFVRSVTYVSSNACCVIVAVNTTFVADALFVKVVVYKEEACAKFVT